MSGRNAPRGRGYGRGRGGRGGRGESREVKISKQLSYILRHGAQKENVAMDDGGWANVADILGWSKIKAMGVTFVELRNVVATNDKKRFTLIPVPEPSGPLLPPLSSSPPITDANDPSRFLIRAAQGHSVDNLSSDKLLTPILGTDADCPEVVLHGSDLSRWDSIFKSGGLNRMSRMHVHFARKEPPPLPELPPGGKGTKHVARGEDGVVSGIRQTATLYVWVDIKKSMDSGMKWYRGDNDVILTEGHNGFVGLQWIVCAEKRGTDEVLFGDKEKLIKLKERQRAAPSAAKFDLGSINGLTIEDSVPSASAVSRPKVKSPKSQVHVKDDWYDGSPER